MMSICHDEDCPRCGWPETYVEGETAPERIGCRKCGWVEEITSLPVRRQNALATISHAGFAVVENIIDISTETLEAIAALLPERIEGQ